MARDMTSPAHPRMLLWGQLRRCNPRCMWRWSALKLEKFGRGANVGGFARSATTSSNVIKVSILSPFLGWVRTHTGGRSDTFFCLLRTVDCSLE